MRPFRVHKGKVAPLERANVDTDQIIPKQFLKRIERTGFGEFLFCDWRRTPDGRLDPAFSLNEPRYSGGGVLVDGKDFGLARARACGERSLHWCASPRVLFVSHFHAKVKACKS